MAEVLDKVTATPAALKLLAEIVADHGPVMFHQSGGCCDGSSPMCYPQGDFLLEGSGNALAAAIYGPGPRALASLGKIALHGDVAAAQEFTDLFSLKPQIRSSSESPEEIEQAPVFTSTSSTSTVPSLTSMA